MFNSSFFLAVFCSPIRAVKPVLVFEKFVLVSELNVKETDIFRLKINF